MTGGFESAEAAFAAHVEEVGGQQFVDAETKALMERVRMLAGTATLEARGIARSPCPWWEGAGISTVARASLDHVRRGGFEFVLLHGESGVGKIPPHGGNPEGSSYQRLSLPSGATRRTGVPHPPQPTDRCPRPPRGGTSPQALEEPWRAVIAALLPHLPAGMERSEVPHIAESSLSRRLYDAFWMLFTQMAQDAPTLLFIDDIHWADATTIAVLQFVQRRWRGDGSFGVVCTMRTDQIQDGSGVDKYLQDGGEALAVTRISVGDLDNADARDLVERVAEGNLAPAVADRLCQLGGRNPFYLIELTKDYLEGQFRLPELPSDAVIVPISIRQLVDPRFRALSPSAEQALSLLAVWGTWVPLADLAALGRAPLEDTIGRVEELERHRLVKVDADQVRIAHELFRGAVYHRLSEARRAMLHRMVAEFLVTQPDPQPGELAVHFGRAGNREQAAIHGRRAADDALENGAMAEAAHFLQVVVDNERDEVLRAEATGDLGSALHMGRELGKAIAILELATQRLRAIGHVARALRMEVRRVEALTSRQDVPATQLRHTVQQVKSEARRRGDDEAWALALDAELHLLNREGDMESIRRVFDEVGQCARSADPVAQCVANASLAVTVLFKEGSEALCAARLALQLAERHHLSQHLVLAQSRLFMVLLRMGLFVSDEARTVLQKALLLAERSGDVAFRAHLLINQGVAAMDSYHLDEAERYFDASATAFAHATDSVGLYKIHCNLGEVAYLQSDFDKMIRHYRAAEVLGQGTVPADSKQVVSAGIGLASLELGDLKEARTRDAETTRMPDEWHFDPFIFLCFRARVLERGGAASDAVDLLVSHADRFRPWMPVLALKLVFIAAKIGRRTGNDSWRRYAEAGIEAAEERQLFSWVRQLQLLLT